MDQNEPGEGEGRLHVSVFILYHFFYFTSLMGGYGRFETTKTVLKGRWRLKVKGTYDKL